MANEPDAVSAESMQNRESAGTDKARMRAGLGRGRDSSGRPDETGIRNGEPGNSPQSSVDTNDGQPSKQTSTAKDTAGQL
jgi:hypothetical protein